MGSARPFVMSPEQRQRMESNRAAAMQRRGELRAMASQRLVQHRPERRHADLGISMNGSRAAATPKAIASTPRPRPRPPHPGTGI
jgi:hypothetical protein